MKIKVRAFASFREVLGRETDQEMDEGSTVKDLLDNLAASNQRFKAEAFHSSGDLKNYVLLMKNRKRIDPSGLEELKDGDEVAVFPPVAGG